MVGTICPMVHGANSACQRIAVIAAHLVGSAVGAGIIGALSGVVGKLLHFSRYTALGLTVLAALSAIYAVGETMKGALPHPQSSLRVPPDWRRFGPPLAALLYGAGLGIGVGTPIQVSSFYVVLAWTMLFGKPIIAAAMLLGFGVGRVIPILALSNLGTNEAFIKADGLSWNLGLIQAANQCALAFAAVVFLFNAWSR